MFIELSQCMNGEVRIGTFNSESIRDFCSVSMFEKTAGCNAQLSEGAKCLITFTDGEKMSVTESYEWLSKRFHSYRSVPDAVATGGPEIIDGSYSD